MRGFILISFFTLFTFILHAQPDAKYNGAEIKESIRKLNVLGSVLYIAAHPDDENTRLITYFSKEKLYNTAYLSLTRGDGGQNLLGTELNEQLGVIRTQELLAARTVDGGKQFFSRAKDFGFSKTPDETFEVWNREKVLADVVWVIRNFQPDVLITRFNTEPGRTHGHHTASAILAIEAFDAAADSNRFPEQLKYVSTWQAKRILWNTNSWFFANKEDFKTDSLLKINVGSYNEALGKSYTEIAAESRSMHKSQGFGASGTRGEEIEYLEHTKGPKAKTDVFEGVNTSWTKLTGGEAIEAALKKIYENYSIENPAASLDELLNVRKMVQKLPDSHWKKIKLSELDKVIKSCLGLWTEVTASDYSAVPGETIKVTTEVINRSTASVGLKNIRFLPSVKDSSFNLTLIKNKDHIFSTLITLPPSLPYSEPYWLRETGTVGMFKVSDQQLIGMAENPPAIEIEFSMIIKGEPITFTTPLVYKKTDPVKGEQYRPFEVTPPVFINTTENLLLFADNKSKSILVTLKAGTDAAKGNLLIDVPSGWKATPNSLPFFIAKKGMEIKLPVDITPSPSPMDGKLQLKAVVSSDTFHTGIVTINYDHIPAQTLFPEASIKVTRLDIKKKGETIGYIMGAGDEVATALKEIGYHVTMINENAVTQEALSKFDAIVIGIRAFNTNEKLKAIHPLLLKYVKNGGTLVVQYNTVPNRIVAGAYVTDSISPYPLTLSRDRVTKEDAEVRFLDPKHPLLNYPNKITKEDFENWVQERGLYFPNEWSKEYQPVISFNDPGESPKDGSILYAKYGKGIFIYTGISFFRELPAGVPGAYRLFVNLISAKQ